MRAIWSGAISFGLVNIPVKLYSAVSEESLDLDMLHGSDLSPVRYARICKAEEKEIPYSEIVKGFEYEKGRYVVLTDEDFEHANIRVTHSIVILDFAKEEEIDPSFFEKPYYLAPDKGAERPYSLLIEALKRSGKVGVGKFVLRNREHLALLRASEKALILEQLRFASGVRDIKELSLPGTVELDQREVEMALELIVRQTRKFSPEEYKDTYTNELKRVIADKVAGKIPAAKGEIPIPTRVPDLMAVLKKSLEKEKTKT